MTIQQLEDAVLRELIEEINVPEIYECARQLGATDEQAKAIVLNLTGEEYNDR